jgi:pseudomonalisin
MLQGRRSTIAAAAALCALVVTVVPSAAAGRLAAPATAGVPGIPGALPPQVSGAVDEGPLPAATPVEVGLSLPLRDRAGLEARVTALLGRQPGARGLSPVELGRYMPDPSTAAVVRGWARAAGLEVLPDSSTLTLVALRGTAARVGSAFGVRLHRFQAGDLVYRSPDRAATLAPQLAGRVEAVLGLSDLGAHRGTGPARPREVPAVPSPASGPALAGRSLHAPRGPADFWSVYHLPPGVRGEGQAVAVIAAGDVGPARRDLTVFEDLHHLPHVPWTPVTVGPPSLDPVDTTEWDLDTQYAVGFAPGVASLIVYDASSLGDVDVVAALDRWVTDHRTRQASFSAGECEDVAHRTGFQAATEAILLRAVAQGQTLFTASGDTGSWCPRLVDLGDAGHVSQAQPLYPGASPYAVSVGGTTLLDGPGALREVAWTDGGGGRAQDEPEPPYQAGAGGSFVSGRRGTPDVSLDADPDTGYEVVEDGQPITVGGTSAGAPAWLGIWARAQSARGGRLGFAAPVLYSLPVAAFTDIVAGFQGLWASTPGWDYCTGRGTPDVTALIAALPAGPGAAGVPSAP